jgi:hypothetical protein
VNIESRSAGCFVASAVLFPRKTFEKERGPVHLPGLAGLGLDVLDEAVRGEAKNALDRHVPQMGSDTFQFV